VTLVLLQNTLTSFCSSFISFPVFGGILGFKSEQKLAHWSSAYLIYSASTGLPGKEVATILTQLKYN